MSWETTEDFERDLILFSEFGESSTDNEASCPVPDSIKKYREEMEKNKNTGPENQVNEGYTYFISGRGRGIKDRIIRPGEPVEYHPSDDADLSKRIRKVAGMGYSNAFIEQTIKARAVDAHDVKNSLGLEWVVCPSTSSPTKLNSKKSNPTKEVILCSPSTSPPTNLSSPTKSNPSKENILCSPSTSPTKLNKKSNPFKEVMTRSDNQPILNEKDFPPLQ